MGVYLETKISNRSGSVDTITLPVLEDEDSIYIVSVQKDEYHSAYIIDAKIYPDITTTYDIYLRHYTFSGTPDFEFIMEPQIPGKVMNPRIPR